MDGGYSLEEYVREFYEKAGLLKRSGRLRSTFHMEFSVLTLATLEIIFPIKGYNFSYFVTLRVDVEENTKLIFPISYEDIIFISLEMNFNSEKLSIYERILFQTFSITFFLNLY